MKLGSSVNFSVYLLSDNISSQIVTAQHIQEYCIFLVSVNRKIHDPFKWIQLNGNVKIGQYILKKLTIFTSSI